MAKTNEEVQEAPEAVQDQNEVDELDEQVDPNEEIFDGGPTNAMIDEWKEAYDGNVFYVPFQHRGYVYRTIYRSEYKRILRVEGATEEYRKEQVVARAMLWPENYTKQVMDGDHAGIVDTLFEYIMATSGFRPETGPIKL